MWNLLKIASDLCEKVNAVDEFEKLEHHIVENLQLKQLKQKWNASSNLRT